MARKVRDKAIDSREGRRRLPPQRLINAAEPDFRLLLQAALQTGARYGELARLTVADFNSDVGTVSITLSKSGKSRHVVLTDEGMQFFRGSAPAGRATKSWLRKANRSAWEFAHQTRPMEETVTRARIAPSISFHGLRHTWASHVVMNTIVRRQGSRLTV
jgi:integrase